ncbi:hypothetical protein ACFL3G_13355 [Planctomycetota bacterium]
MNTYKKFIIALMILIGFGFASPVLAVTYYEHTAITTPDINSHSDNDTVYAGGEFVLTCIPSTDIDKYYDCGEWHYPSDNIVHTWSGPGSFSPTTGTSTLWTAPVATGDVNITVTADDTGSPNYYDSASKSDTVTLTVTNIIYAKTGATGKNDGSSWANAEADLGWALTNAGHTGFNDNEIWVAEGTYTPGGGQVVRESIRETVFCLQDHIEVYGGFAGTETSRGERDYVNNVTIMSGDHGALNSYHVVAGDGDANTVLDGFTITKGLADTYFMSEYDVFGGGMFNLNCSPTIANCNFIDNDANFGGGLADFNSSPTITNCIFSENIADSNGSGGGMYNSYSSPVVTDCIFINNEANTVGDYNEGADGLYRSGGGMLNYFSTPTITNCVFSENFADDFGGAIQNLDSNCIITSCLFSNNSAATGGAIVNERCAPIITNCTIVDNNAVKWGGGMQNYDGSDTIITNCIFWGNRYSGGSGGSGGHQIDNFEAYGETCEPNVSYCDIEGGLNNSPGCSGDDSIDGGGNVDGDPNFVDDTNPDGNDNTWMTSDDGFMIGDSNCIDSANGNVDPTTDILGNGRYDNTNITDTGIGDPDYVDMGAYEKQSS